MIGQLRILVCSAGLAALLGGCHFYYFANARVPLSAPADPACLRSTLTDAGPYGHLASRHLAEGRMTVTAYDTPSMFRNRWVVVSQIARRDSGVYRGTVHRDSSATLSSTYVQVNRPISGGQGRLTTAEMAANLLDLARKCGGRTVDQEPLFTADVTDTPYRAWTVPGTSGRTALRLTVEERTHWGNWVRNSGRFVLRVDTIAADASLTHPRWLEVDSLELPAPRDGKRLATQCWRGDAPPAADIVAHVDDVDGQYHTTIHAAWELDRAALRIRPVSTNNIECRNPEWGSVFPDAPRLLRTDAITFRPARGMARIYAMLTKPHFPRETEIATVAVDSQLVGSLDGGSFLMVEVDPGRRRVSSVTGTHENILWVDAMPDSSYFVELRREQFAWSRRFRATVRAMDPQRAREAIRLAHMVTSSWPGTPLGTPK